MLGAGCVIVLLITTRLFLNSIQLPGPLQTYFHPFAPTPTTDQRQFLLTLNKPAPEIPSDLTVLNSTSKIKLADYKGKVILINFWAMNCSFCTDTLPFIEAFREKYANDNVVVLGVFISDFYKPAWTRDQVRQFLSTYKVTYPTIVDVNLTLNKAYDLHYAPTTIVIDKSGKIRYEVFGTFKATYHSTELDSVTDYLLEH